MLGFECEAWRRRAQVELSTDRECQKSMMRAHLVAGRVSTFIAAAAILITILPRAIRAEEAKEVQLTLEQEKASYGIYSTLLRSEMPAAWNIAAWVIRQYTQSFPAGMANSTTCLEPAVDREATYRPLIDDYIRRNRYRFRLKRKFNLPQYAMVDDAEVRAIQERFLGRAPESDPVPGKVLEFPFNASVIFHVSAVGFNSEMTRALVYVGHVCGGLCGGGTYHFMIKKDGRWVSDRNYRGLTCTWVS